MKTSASCQTLSKALEMSKKIPQVSKERFVSKSLDISCLMDNDWDTQEWPLRKTDWLLEKTFKLIIKCIIDTLFINSAENWEKRHWSMIVD